MKVLLLAGGKSLEHDVSVRSGQTIALALDKLGYEYENFDPICSDVKLLEKAKQFDVVFIALHGKPGEDGTIQELFEDNNIAFIGSDSACSKICIDKWKLKKLMDDNDIKNPSGKLISADNVDRKLLEKPYVLKPCDEGSSFETLIVRQPRPENTQAAMELLQLDKNMLLEELIDGPEITVGVFRDEALPVIEIIPPDGEEFDYDNKYNGKTKEIIPPINVSQKVQEQSQELALKIHKLAGCRDMSRTDFMVSENGQLYMLETNTIPGLTDKSLLPKMIVNAGYTMTEFVDSLLKSALSR